LVVSDTGVGIDPAIRDRIFEPYFTTKEMEKGTGLGLATAHGIIQQSGGSIEVESEPGQGTSFRVRLRRVPAPASRTPEEPPPPARSLAGTTVLLTEDEINIREALVEYLEGLGLRVLEAKDGVEALDVVSGYEGEIDVLVTDLVMPRMSGPDLASKLAAERDDLKIVYVSGYTPDAMQDYGVKGDDVVFLQKPFLLAELADTIREVLED
jgi:two-component system cell cycle sensor histidine kinase/response regulator CckA